MPICLRNPAIEEFLNANSIPFHWEERIPFASINRRKSWENQSRVADGCGSRVIEDAVMRYDIALRSGAMFPGVVGWRHDKQFLLCDGNQRCEAFRRAGLDAAGATVGGYVLDTDDAARIDYVTRCLNNVNGVPPDFNERVIQAVRFLERYPQMRQEEVAKRFGVSQSSISSRIRANRVEEVAHANGIRTTGLPTTVLMEVSKLSSNEPVMLAALETVARHKCTGDQAREIVGRAKRAKSESTKLEAITQCEQQLERSKPAVVERRTSVKSQFHRAMSLLFGVVSANPTAEHLTLTSKSELDEVRRDWKRLREMVDKALK